MTRWWSSRPCSSTMIISKSRKVKSRAACGLSGFCFYRAVLLFRTGGEALWYKGTFEESDIITTFLY